MSRSTFWLLCLLGCAIFNQGLARPQEDYQEDEDGDDYVEQDEDKLHGPPPQITSTKIEAVVDPGEEITFPCNVEGDPRDYARMWRKDGRPLYLGTVSQHSDPRIKNLEDGSLVVQQVKASDSGTYSCVIAMDKDVQHMLNVKSLAKIDSIEPIGKTVIRKGSNIQMKCQASGYPTPSIKFFHNGAILDVQSPSIQGATYTITNASIEDAGFYKCTASNQGQQQPDERTVEIEVHFPPQITIARATVPTAEGLVSELKCTVSGMKEPELKWYRNEGRKLITKSPDVEFEDKNHVHILRILKTKKSDFGDYMCEAKNSEGKEQAIITLTGKPSRPEPDTVKTEAESKNTLLSFKVESFVPIEEYELLYKREEKDEWTSVKLPVTPPSEPHDRFYTVKHELKNLEPGVYNAQLKARNSNGWSEMSTKVTFPREHDGDFTETGLLAVEDNSAASELRISLALVTALLVAHFYC